MVSVLDLAEARRLISEAGYRPYVRKVKGREYITLKRGSREVGVGPFNQDVWDSLQSEWVIATYGSKASTTPVQGQTVKPRLDSIDAATVFEWLEAGYDPARIVKETRLHPDVVENATMRYLELKRLNPRAIAELTDTVEKVLNGVVAPFVEEIGACAGFRQRFCRNFEGEACTLYWDASEMEKVKAPENAKPFEVFESFDDGGRRCVRIRPTPVWCLACPFYERR
jgi:hypothetical protein